MPTSARPELLEQSAPHAHILTQLWLRGKAPILLCPDQGQHARNHEHLRACIKTHALLEVPWLGTFIGRDPSRTVTENLMLARQVLTPLVEFAGERGVKIVVENCPMPGWYPDGYPGNLAYSPELWERMFSLGLYFRLNSGVPLGSHFAGKAL